MAIVLMPATTRPLPFRMRTSSVALKSGNSKMLFTVGMSVPCVLLHWERLGRIFYSKTLNSCCREQVVFSRRKNTLSANKPSTTFDREYSSTYKKQQYALRQPFQQANFLLARYLGVL